jgi:hypothetical protein
MRSRCTRKERALRLLPYVALLTTTVVSYALLAAGQGSHAHKQAYRRAPPEKSSRQA